MPPPPQVLQRQKSPGTMELKYLFLIVQDNCYVKLITVSCRWTLNIQLKYNYRMISSNCVIRKITNVTIEH